MKSGIKIIHWIFFLWLTLFVLRFDLLFDYLSLNLNYIKLLINDPSSALSFMSFNFIDHLLSASLFLLAIPLIIMFKKRLRFLETRLDFSLAFLTLLCFVFLFAPVISNENPEFSKNLSVTKLLPPFSSVAQMELKNEEAQNETEAESFRNKYVKIIRPLFDDKIIYADSVVISEKVIYYQKNIANEIDSKYLVDESGVPLIKNKYFPFGTDEFGRDLLARLIYGTRISITVGLGAVILSFIIGILLGFISGYRGGIVDVLLNRFTEMFLAFPVIYLIVLILALFGSSIFSVIIVLGISGWMSLFKMVKSEVLSIKQKDYFATAELVGLNKSKLLAKEIFPVIITPVLVYLIFLFSNVILARLHSVTLGLVLEIHIHPGVQ